MPFQIVRNDITKMQVDAIVNTANPLPGYGAGIDTAVYEAAGKEDLLAERRRIGTIGEGCSVITPGFGLPAKFIIHTVGVPWQGGAHGEEEILRNCYRSLFHLASENHIESLAIPLLSSGSYGFPKGIALRIALSEIETYLKDHETEVYLVVFDEKSFSLSAELYGDIDSYINDRYVEERTDAEYAADVSDWDTGYFAAAKYTQSGSFTPPFMAPEPESPRKKRRIQAPRLFGLHSAAPKQPSASEDQTKIPDAASMAASNAFPMGAVDAVPMAVPLAAKSLEDVVNNLDKTFMELVFSFADEKHMTDVEVQKKANLDRKAFSKLKCGTTKNPSKSTALALAVALELNLDETKDLLSRAGLALSPCSRQDLIVQYFLERKAYDIYEINVALFEHGEQLLGCAVNV